MYKLNACLDLGPNGGRVSSLDVVAALFLMPWMSCSRQCKPHEVSQPATPSCPTAVVSCHYLRRRPYTDSPPDTRTHICPCMHGVAQPPPAQPHHRRLQGTCCTRRPQCAEHRRCTGKSSPSPTWPRLNRTPARDGLASIESLHRMASPRCASPCNGKGMYDHEYLFYRISYGSLLNSVDKTIGERMTTSQIKTVLRRNTVFMVQS